jgi:phosphohistidine swiveling domain-containing protein
VTLPGAWLEEYLTAKGLGARLTILAGRFPQPPASLEAALELSLEAYWLFQRYPFPEALEARILAAADALEGELLVRASGPACGASGLELWSAGTRAALLNAIRAAWSRAYSPSAGRVPAWPTITVLERGSAPAQELAIAEFWSERLSDGRSLGMAPRDLEQKLESAAARSGLGEDLDSAPLSEIGAYARYALGCSYNSVLAPDDPFEFLGLLLPGAPGGAAQRERYLTLSQASGRPDGQAYLELAARALALETRGAEGGARRAVPGSHGASGLAAPSDRGAPPAKRSGSGAAALERGLAALGPAPTGARGHTVLAQQLIGSPSSPGRAAGVLRHASGAGLGPEEGGAQSPVLCCESFRPELLALKPVAVIESLGGRIGAGALLAREAGLPCVSGVRDTGMLREGVSVRVDGWLGLVSVASDDSGQVSGPSAYRVRGSDYGI